MSKIRAVIVDPNVPGRLALSEVNTPKPALDYGYLQDTQSGDGNNIDVWIGSLLNQTVTAVICSVDLEKRDTEIKILLGCTSDERQAILDIHNIGSQSAILLVRK